MVVTVPRSDNNNIFVNPHRNLGYLLNDSQYWGYGSGSGGGGVNTDCIILKNLAINVNCNDIIRFEQDYKNRMAASEKAIFESMSRAQQLGYLFNAQKASWKAKELFPNSLRNGKGDAFRHAYWNGLNEILLGDALATNLATAHEDKPPIYAYSNKEKQMDLFNNSVGRSRSNWLSNGYSSLSESILDAMSNGELRYLSHLHGGISRATNQSQLIPTN
ncbi:DUF6973 domain-containing protein [Maribacter sp. 2304DJ31-5]|uniref:DUF6973 domain-containing protein n=1 Tax=Maribacter sp. 2304DJ31-5 TaxID=3386273 RepID=UPI0039BC9AB6